MSAHHENASTAVRSRRNAGIVIALVAAALLIAGLLSFYASSSPDGLTKVAQDQQFSSLEESHAAEDSPLAGYATSGVEDERLSGGLAGVVGVTLTFLIGGGVFLLVRRRSAT